MSAVTAGVLILKKFHKMISLESLLETPFGNYFMYAAPYSHCLMMVCLLLQHTYGLFLDINNLNHHSTTYHSLNVRQFSHSTVGFVRSKSQPLPADDLSGLPDSEILII